MMIARILILRGIILWSLLKSSIRTNGGAKISRNIINGISENLVSSHRYLLPTSRFLLSSHFHVMNANNTFKGTDRSRRCQRLGATYRLKCLLSVADATRRTRTSSGCRHVASSEAAATGNFANVRRRVANGSLPFSLLFIFQFSPNSYFLNLNLTQNLIIKYLLKKPSCDSN